SHILTGNWVIPARGFSFLRGSLCLSMPEAIYPGRSGAGTIKDSIIQTLPEFRMAGASEGFSMEAGHFVPSSPGSLNSLVGRSATGEAVQYRDLLRFLVSQGYQLGGDHRDLEVIVDQSRPFTDT